MLRLLVSKSVSKSLQRPILSKNIRGHASESKGVVAEVNAKQEVNVGRGKTKQDVNAIGVEAPKTPAGPALKPVEADAMKVAAPKPEIPPPPPPSSSPPSSSPPSPVLKWSFVGAVLAILGEKLLDIGGDVAYKKSGIHHQVEKEEEEKKAKEAKEAYEAGVRNKIINSKINLGLPKNYVSRSFEKTIAKWVNSPIRGSYMVVVGARGTGKTTAVAAACEGKTRVVRVTLTKEESCEKKLANVLGVENTKDLKRMLLSAWDGNIAPTIVLEIERGTSNEEVIIDAARTAKMYGPDWKVANFIVLLSDNHAAFALPDDRGRQAFVCVDDFTVEEANKFADGIGLLNGEENKLARSVFFEMIGCRVVDLVKATEYEDLDGYVRETLNHAEGKLKAFRDDFKFLTELMKKPDGIAANELLAGSDGRNPKTVAEISKKNGYHPVLYSQCTGCYNFQSQAYKYVALHPDWKKTKFSDVVQQKQKEKK